MSASLACNRDRGDSPFRQPIAENIFYRKYAQGPHDSWHELCRRVIDDVCGCGIHTKWHFPMLSSDEQERLLLYMSQMKFIPGGRYLYYAGRPAHFWNNCFLLRAEEDTREEWSRTVQKAMSALMCGGGIGVDYSIIREQGRMLSRTGGVSSGPIPLMMAVNECGRNVMQGGSRRSAIYASLNWRHKDLRRFITAKEWSPRLVELKADDFNWPAPLDMTNTSINWDNSFLRLVARGEIPGTWVDSVRQMMMTGEPGHSYNFGPNENETLRNACGEVCSEDDSDVCNLGSVNLSRIESLDEFADVCQLGAKLLICGTVRGDLPYRKVYEVRNKNRRIGLGLMGVHEWLLRRGQKYEVIPELRQWLSVWVDASERGANDICDRFYLNRPVKYRSIAPTGTIGILASTTTGIEPMYAVAYKRRYLVNGTQWKFEYVVDATAQYAIEKYGIDPADMETAFSLAADPGRRIKFQCEVQKYVDHAISSTINLPAWGSDLNNEDRVHDMSKLLLKYCVGLRGITMYPDGARGGQPLEVVDYGYAMQQTGVVFDEEEFKCKGGICGI